MTTTTLLHDTTPNELIENIIDGVNQKFEELKEQFQPKQPTEYLTRNEVRDLLKVDLSTIHHYTKKGKLKAYGIGARVYYKRHEVEASLIPLKQ